MGQNICTCVSKSNRIREHFWARKSGRILAPNKQCSLKWLPATVWNLEHPRTNMISQLTWGYRTLGSQSWTVQMWAVPHQLASVPQRSSQLFNLNHRWFLASPGRGVKHKLRKVPPSCVSTFQFFGVLSREKAAGQLLCPTELLWTQQDLSCAHCSSRLTLKRNNFLFS